MNDPEHASTNEDADNEFLPPRPRVRPSLIIAIIVLVVLVVAGGIFATTRFVGRSANATPTPTLVPGSNLFYIQTSPGWGNIFVDGQKLAHIPDPSANDLPLQLSAGVHEVTWQADPFAQKCTIIVPPVLSETKCLANDPVTVPKGPNKGLPAFLINFTASFSDLTPAQQQPLFQAAQKTLDALQSSDTVQPGEQYADLNAPQFTATASSPLRATLRYQLITDINLPVPCAGPFLGFGSVCRYNGQDCHLLCTVQEEPPTLAPPDRWDVFGIVRASWTYTTLNGEEVAQNQPDETDNTGTVYQVSLYITHTDNQWHVTTSVPGNTTSTFLYRPSCAAAYNAVTQVSFQTYNTINLPDDPNQSINWSATSRANLAAGCLLTAYPQENGVVTNTNPKPVAHCLYRFGVLLALDNATHSYWPNLPLADAYEKGIAKHSPA